MDRRMWSRVEPSRVGSGRLTHTRLFFVSFLCLSRPQSNCCSNTKFIACASSLSLASRNTALLRRKWLIDSHAMFGMCVCVSMTCSCVASTARIRWRWWTWLYFDFSILSEGIAACLHDNLRWKRISFSAHLFGSSIYLFFFAYSNMCLLTECWKSGLIRIPNSLFAFRIALIDSSVRHI